MAERFKYSISAFIQRAIDRRSPRLKKITLGIRSIYVLPSGYGWLFMLLTLVIWLLGTNYQNNLILATAFLLMSFQFVAIFYTWRNLAGLTFEAAAAEAAFAGENATFTMKIFASKYRGYRNIRVARDTALEKNQAVDLFAGTDNRFQLEQPALQRGLLSLDRIRIETSYPFGLIRCWSWMRVDMQVPVFPAPVFAAPASGKEDFADGSGLMKTAGNDFYGFSAWQPGSPLSRIAWKHFARGAGLHLKEFAGHQGSDLWVDWQEWQHVEMETCLSAMCFRILECDNASLTYGVRLPDQMIAPATGESHKLESLTALALFGTGTQTGGAE